MQCLPHGVGWACRVLRSYRDPTGLSSLLRTAGADRPASSQRHQNARAESVVVTDLSGGSSASNDQASAGWAVSKYAVHRLRYRQPTLRRWCAGSDAQQLGPAQRPDVRGHSLQARLQAHSARSSSTLFHRRRLRWLSHQFRDYADTAGALQVEACCFNARPIRDTCHWAFPGGFKAKGGRQIQAISASSMAFAA